MMYYLVAVMSIIHVDMSRDVYIFDYDFVSFDHCQYYHAVNEIKIDDFLVKTYNYSQDVHQIFCVDLIAASFDMLFRTLNQQE